jgi:hypothetical protein
MFPSSVHQRGATAGMADDENRLPDLLSPETWKQQVVQDKTDTMEQRAQRYPH